MRTAVGVLYGQGSGGRLSPPEALELMEPNI
jgi:hypothetical protein